MNKDRHGLTNVNLLPPALIYNNYCYDSPIIDYNNYDIVYV